MAGHRVRNKYSIKGCRLGQFGGMLPNLIFKFGNKPPTRCLVLRIHLVIFCGIGATLVAWLHFRGANNITLLENKECKLNFAQNCDLYKLNFAIKKNNANLFYMIDVFIFFNKYIIMFHSCNYKIMSNKPNI